MQFLTRSLFILLLGIPIQVAGQQYLGLSTSNHAGIHSMYLNPAAAGSGKIGFYLNLFSIDVGFSNSFLQYRGETSFPSFLKDGASFNEEYFERSAEGGTHFLSAGVDVRGPGMLIRLNDKSAFALSTRYRGFAQANNLSHDLGNLLWNDMQGVSTTGTAQGQSLQSNVDLLSEAALSYSRTVWATEAHTVRVGLTGKGVNGHYAAHSDYKNLSYEATPDTDGNTQLSMQSWETDYAYSRFGASADYGYSNVLLMRAPIARGWGADIGVQYEYFGSDHLRLYEPDSLGRSPKLYKLKVGLSMTDIGKVHYKAEENIRRYQASRQGTTFSTARFDGADWEDMDLLLYDILEVQPEERLSDFAVKLPQALHLTVDYRLSRKLYLNTLWTQGFAKNNAFAIKQFDFLTISPRYEAKGFEAALPITLHNRYSTLAAGAMVRLGPLVAGTSNLLSLIGAAPAYDANFYAAFVIPVMISSPKKPSAVSKNE